MPFFIHFRHSVVSFIKTAHTIILWKWLVVHPFQMMKLTILPTTCILSILYTSFARIRFWMVLTYVSQQYTDAHSMELTFLRSNYVHIQWHKLVVSRLLCELMTNFARIWLQAIECWLRWKFNTKWQEMRELVFISKAIFSS